MTYSSKDFKWALYYGQISKQDSDIDLLIAFSSEVRQGFLTLAKIKHELESMIGRSVDVSVKESIEDSNNWIRRQEILTTAQTIYEQR